MKILLLEDSAVDAEIITRLLKNNGIGEEIYVANNKKSYEYGLESFRPELILSDNSLPQFDASQALDILHERNIKLPFILITGTVSEEFAAGIIKKGADDYILKDRLARLPAAIDAALKQKRIEKEKELAI